MKNKIKNNKTVIRTKRIVGNFTTIPHRILHDKRLTTDSRILLCSILSDADTFTVSRTGLINRLGITEYILGKSFRNLIDCGYVKKSKVHAQYFHYTISEYGNLNKSDSKTVEPQKAPIQDEPSKTVDEYRQMINEFVSKKIGFIEDEWIRGINHKINSKDDYHTELSKLTKLVKQAKTEHYKALEVHVNGGYANKDLKPKILKEVRRLITDEHKKPSKAEVDKIRYRISHNKYKNKVEKHGFDYETQLVDQGENPLD